MRSALCLNVFLACVVVALGGGHECDMSAYNPKKPPVYDVKIVTDAYDDCRNPHWDPCTQKLLFVKDNQHICRLDHATGTVTSVYIKGSSKDNKVRSVVPLAGCSDKIVACMGKHIGLVTWNEKSNGVQVPFETLKTLEFSHDDTEVCGGKPDSFGRLWIGTKRIGKPNERELHYVDNDFQCQKEISPVSLSNGMAWNIEDNKLYYIDSHQRAVAECDWENGKMYNHRILLPLNNTEDCKGEPRGMTIDRTGNLWIPMYGGQHVIEVDPKERKIKRKIEIPAKHVTSCEFGGPHLDTLYVTASKPKHYGVPSHHEETYNNKYRHAGGVFAVNNLGVRGCPANSMIRSSRRYNHF